jgi:UDP-N-acetylglucosamine acyltransferase
MIVEGRHARVRNVNIIGLQRAGFAEEEIEELRMAHRRVFRSREPQSQAIEALRRDPDAAPIVRRLIDALDRTEAGRKGRHREALREEFARLGAERLAEEARS